MFSKMTRFESLLEAVPDSSLRTVAEAIVEVGLQVRARLPSDPYLQHTNTPECRRTRHWAAGGRRPTIGHGRIEPHQPCRVSWGWTTRSSFS